MKYIITERQYNILKEIGRESGHFDFEPLESFYEFMEDKVPKKQKVKLFKEFFREKMGFGVEEDDFLVSDIIDYFENPLRSEWGDIFKTKDARSGFAYFVAKKYFGLKEKFGLNYIINRLEDDDTIIYYFFDPILKIFIGRFVIEKFRKKIYKVHLSAVDEELIGTGYGTKMYLIVIDDVDYLASDTILYSGSYRIWKHVLPKYVNVWGIIHNDEWGLPTTVVKMDDKGKKSVKRFDYFLASSKHKKL
jgi:hypothetical protein